MFRLLLLKKREIKFIKKTAKTGNSSSWWIKSVFKNHRYRKHLDKVDHMIIGGGMTFTL
jgi:hypothetical protein